MNNKDNINENRIMGMKKRIFEAMYKANCEKYRLKFKQPGGTSRGILTEKETWLVELYEESNPAVRGRGECNLFKGLSADDSPEFENKIKDVCSSIHEILPDFHNILRGFPSIRSGIEQAKINLKCAKNNIYFPSDFTSGKSSIKINGLIWMGDADFMKKQIDEKISEGFGCIKIKIGALKTEDEIDILKYIRNKAPDIEIRVDANGAFTPENVIEKLNLFAEFKIHSVEQPIRQKQTAAMKMVCKNSPIPVALDEELIGVNNYKDKKELLKTIQPQYIILKPGLLGGFNSCEEWIALAVENKLGWWITSALESNIGLNAIAQWTFTLKNKMPQGLGTGSLFTNNIKSPLQMEHGKLKFNPEKNSYV